jgi:hypothetical protein
VVTRTSGHSRAGATCGSEGHTSATPSLSAAVVVVVGPTSSRRSVSIRCGQYMSPKVADRRRRQPAIGIGLGL